MQGIINQLPDVTKIHNSIVHMCYIDSIIVRQMGPHIIICHITFRKCTCSTLTACNNHSMLLHFYFFLSCSGSFLMYKNILTRMHQDEVLKNLSIILELYTYVANHL